MLVRRTRQSLLAVAIVGIAACGNARTVTKSAERHRLNASPGVGLDGYALTYDARGRGAYLIKQRKDGKSMLRLCAEPPPDVAANLEASSSFDAQLEALLKFKAVDASLDAAGKGSSSATSEIANAATRTELVLLMRDALYRICEMNANGNLTADQAADSFEALVHLARNLGQRDNVAKLIDVVRIAFQTETPEDPALAKEYVRALQDVLRTVTLLAASDQLAQQRSEVGDLVQESVNKALMESLVGYDEAQKRITKQIEQLEAERTQTQTQLDNLQALPKKKRPKEYAEQLEALRTKSASLQTRLEQLRAVE